MKLLISAYACGPNVGSEHSVGWNWATEAHRQGHQVWVLAASVHRAAIEKACHDDPSLAGIHWTFPEIGWWRLQPKVEPVWERTYNLLWQRAAVRHAARLQSQVGFDAVHHLTWGGIRAPTFLGSLGVPLIIGPIGGGETCPAPLRDGFGLRSKITEWVRSASNATITLNPVVRGGLTKAAAIFVKTPDTRRLLTGAMQRKAVTFFELGLHATQIGTPRALRRSPPRLLFAGRLLYWKGAHIALRAFAALRQSVPDAQLTIVGKGPERDRLKADAQALRLGDSVTFVPWLPQQELFGLYASHDLFVFPSLHDSSGTVVVEALSRGMPVICLDLGGPGQIVAAGSGIAVATAGRDTDAVAAAMASEMAQLFAAPERLVALSEGAIARARDFLLSDRVAQFYGMVEQQVRRVPRAEPQRPDRQADLGATLRPPPASLPEAG
jgi:glycosyltransferase involved in cell wall biosynthesis